MNIDIKINSYVGRLWNESLYNEIPETHREYLFEDRVFRDPMPPSLYRSLSLSAHFQVRQQIYEGPIEENIAPIIHEYMHETKLSFVVEINLDLCALVYARTERPIDDAMRAIHIEL